VDQLFLVPLYYLILLFELFYFFNTQSDFQAFKSHHTTGLKLTRWKRKKFSLTLFSWIPSYIQVTYESSNLPSNSGKYSTKCENIIFSSNKSFLFKNNMMEEFWNQGYVIIVRNNALLSSIRFYKRQRGKWALISTLIKTFMASAKTLAVDNSTKNCCNQTPGNLSSPVPFSSRLQGQSTSTVPEFIYGYSY